MVAIEVLWLFVWRDLVQGFPALVQHLSPIPPFASLYLLIFSTTWLGFL